jgi:hypothetical protein
VSNTGEALTGMQSQQIDVGLLGARTAGVLRRLRSSEPLEPYDRTVLDAAEAMLRRAAAAVEFVSSKGREGSSPGTYGFGAVALTLEATASAEGDSDAVVSLTKLADAVKALTETPSVELADAILPVFSALANVASRTAGSPGDSSLTL